MPSLDTDLILRHIDQQGAHLNQRLVDHHRSLQSGLDAVVQQLQLQNGRIRRLEHWRSWMLGAAGVLGGLLTWLH